MSPLESSVAARHGVTPGSIRRMRIVATGMLVAMAAIFLVTTRLEHLHPAWGFVKAFAEAAMVGGLADWFAVTALFRHPLGIPIPHTAIIPRNKDRIGQTLAQFLRDYFLTPSVVTRRMRGIDVSAAVGRFLIDPPGEGRMREGASRLVTDLLAALDQERLGGMVKSTIAARLRGLEVSPLLGQTLAAAIDENRHIPILDSIVTWAGRTLDANEDLIRKMIHERAGWIMRLAGLDEKLAEAIIDGLRRLSIDMAVDVDHPLRAKAEEALAKLARDLVEDPELRQKVEDVKSDIIANKAVSDWIGTMWERSRASLLQSAQNPEKVMAGRFGEALRQLGVTLQQDGPLKSTINRFARRAVAGTVANYGSGIAKLVSETVRRWDAQTVTGRLENVVGRDLQYIRINGTLVGGLVGLAIHTVEIL